MKNPLKSLSMQQMFLPEYQFYKNLSFDFAYMHLAVRELTMKCLIRGMYEVVLEIKQASMVDLGHSISVCDNGSF